ncbi:MAG TPA: cardiolipin synthase [Burkholderiales bacterium]|nr:cardiolipin synthase [Burkholderiales bacterium]
MSSLPSIERMEQNATGPVQLEGARGPLSTQQSAAILEKLKEENGNPSILERHVAVEEAAVDSPLVIGNKAVLLQDGPATYKAMFAAIRNARHHINLETYIIEDDEVGREFTDLLIAMRKKGVQVTMLYDSVGSLRTPKEFFDYLRDNNIAVLEFNPVNPLAVRKAWLLNNRDHRKLLIVDGRIAFLGGINISSVYSSGSASSGKPAKKKKENGGSDAAPWRDTHVQVEGPVVAEFQKLFMQTWEKQGGEPLKDARFFPKLEVRGKDIVRAVGSASDEAYSRIYVTLVSAINSAESQVQITNAYMVPDEQLLETLVAAAMRGVDVKLIVPSHTDFWAVFHAGRAHYTELLKAGVKIYERQGALLHSKTASIDGVWSCVGSTNLDWRSFLHNNEIDAVILGDEFARQMQTMFDKDLSQSVAIDLETWKHRPIGDRFKEWAAGLWEYWL